ASCLAVAPPTATAGGGWEGVATVRVDRQGRELKQELAAEALPQGCLRAGVASAAAGPHPRDSTPEAAWTPARIPTCSTPPPSSRCAAATASSSQATARSRSATR